MKIYGMFFTLSMGTLLRFTYEWSGRNPFIAVLAPTSGSLFEQLKLLFTPYMLWTLAEYAHYGQFQKNFIPIKAASLFAGMVIILLSLYFSVKVLHRKTLPVDLAAFAVSVPMAFGVDYLLTASRLSVGPAAALAVKLLLFATALAMAAFTLYPPDHPLFTDRNHSS